jgi:hypothetical protein
MKKTISIFACLLAFALTSCSIQEDIHFNKNFSGKMGYTVDFSSMMQMSQMMKMQQGDSASMEIPDFKNEMKGDEIKAAFGMMNSIEGISNTTSDFDEAGKLSLSFDFADLKALNKAYNMLSANKGMPIPDLGGSFNPGTPPTGENKTDEPKKDFEYFSKQGKYLVYRRPKMDNEEMQNTEMKDMMQGLGGMGGSMMKVQTKLSFENQVKKTTVKVFEIDSQDKNEVILNFGLESLGKSNDEPEIKIKLK